MKVITKRRLSCLVLATLLSQQLCNFWFAYSYSLASHEPQEIVSHVQETEIQPIISDEASLNIISDEVAISIPSLEQDKRIALKKQEKDWEADTNSIIVKYRDNRWAIAKSIAESALDSEHDVEIHNMDNLDLGLITFDKNPKDIHETVKKIEKFPFIEYAEPNYQRSLNMLTWVSTNDPRSNELWHLKSIQAEEAWKIYDDNENATRVSINDTGIDYTHTDLIDSLADLSSDCRNASGAIITAWCTKHWVNVEGDYPPLFGETETYDIGWHGTSVAGVVWASRNNAIGISGVTNNTELMSARIHSHNSFYETFYLSDTIKAIDVAIENNAKVVNLSYGGTFFSQAEFDALERAENNGLLIVSSAGNKSENNDLLPHYPSDYDLDNIISVAALWPNNTLSTYSNYGAVSTDIAAPGWDITDFETGAWGILSTIPGQEIVFEETFDTHSGYTVSGSGSDWYTYGGGFWIHTQTPLLYTWSINSTLTFNESFSLSWATLGTLEWYISCDFWSGGTFDNNFWDQLWFYIYDQDIDLDYPISVPYSSYVGEINGKFEAPIMNSYFMKDNLQLKVNFFTDNDNDVWEGCHIDDLELTAHKKNSSSYKYTQGTSLAAPVVTWVAAMLWSYEPSLNYNEIKNIILTSVDNIWLDSSIASGWKVNAQKALKELIRRHGLSKSWELSNELVYTKDISLTAGKDLSLSWTTIELSSTGNNIILQNATISGSWNINLPLGSSIQLNGNTVASNPVVPNIDFHDVLWSSASSSWQVLYGTWIFLDYNESFTGSNLKILIEDVYDGPLSDNLFIPLWNSFSWTLDYSIYLTGEWHTEISDDVIFNLYSGTSLLDFTLAQKHFKVVPEAGAKETGQDVWFSLEAIDFDGSRLESFSWSVTLETNIPSQTQFTGEIINGAYAFPASNNGFKEFYEGLSFSEEWNHELRVYDANDSSFSWSSMIYIGERTIPSWVLEIEWGNTHSSLDITLNITSSEYPVFYTISWDTTSTYTGSLSSSWSLNIELLAGDGQKELHLILEDLDQNTGESTTQLTLDQTAPILDTVSHNNWDKVEWANIQLSWTISDTQWVNTLEIRNAPVSITAGSWSTSVPLIWWENIISYMAEDTLWNTGSGNMQIIRTPKVQNISYLSRWSSSVDIVFKTDIQAGWRVSYGLSPSDISSSLISPSWSEHRIAIDNLQENTLYYYQVQASIWNYTGSTSQIRSFRTEQIRSSTGWWGHSKRSWARISGPLRELEAVIPEVVNISQKISDNELFDVFLEHKEVFQRFSLERKSVWYTGKYDYEDFIQSWKALSYEYESKPEEFALSQKEDFLTIYMELKKEHEKFLSLWEVKVELINGNEFLYIEYDNKTIVQFQILLFSFIKKQDWDIEDYHLASRILRLLNEYTENKDNSQVKNELKQELIQLYQKLITNL